MRRAAAAEEIQVLTERCDKARTDAAERGATDKLDAFELAVADNSCAVICKPITEVLKWLEPSYLYTSFHNAVSSGARIAQDNRFNRVRGSVDELLFPEYAVHINFAALSLDKSGDPYYGDFSVAIKSDAIASRASVFHENSIHFIESNEIKAGSDLPAGYRCSWALRGQLAVAKLASQIDENMEDNDFPGILLKGSTGDNDDDSDFIEVHIFGGILGEAIESIKCNRSYEPGELHILRKTIRQAEQSGIQIQQD